MALDPEFKARWVAALRSGEFKQGDSYLCKGDALCCLGVAQRISGLPHNLGGDRGDEELPPSEHLDAWGLDYDVAQHLAELNDGNRHTAIFAHTFAEIADYIEANL